MKNRLKPKNGTPYATPNLRENRASLPAVTEHSGSTFLLQKKSRRYEHRQVLGGDER